MTDATKPAPALLPRPGLHLRRTPVGLDMRVTIAGQAGTIVTVWPSARGVRYGIAMDSGSMLPSVGIDVLDHPPPELVAGDDA